jgi:predicted DNA-binding transcriptional regulator AlpA
MTISNSDSNRPKKQRGHVSARRPIIDLNCAGRLRTGEVMALCGISHSGLYERKNKGTFPSPDGNDGRNFWNTSTIRNYLTGEQL